MPKKLLLGLLLTLLLLQQTWAQTRTITGTVRSGTDNSPLPGVNVLVKGTNNGTTTNGDGTYSLDVPGEASTLVFSFIGFAAQEVAIGDRSTVDVQLTEDVTNLNEVVVIAYGTQQKKDITGSISSIAGNEIANVPIVSFENAIQGRAAGVQINTGSRAGEANTVRIRGTSSISASSQPLYVIDGIPQGDYIMGYTGNNAQVSPISNLNPNDIASIEVLKDASAAALYGSRASNGVIIVTTKRGKEGKTSINLNAYTGFQEVTNLMPVLNGAQYTELFNEAWAYSNPGQTQILGDPANAIDTDWYDAVFRRGQVQEYSLSASGGTAKTRFYSGITYRDEEGYTLDNDYQRLSGRVNLDHEASDKLSFSANLALTRVLNNRVSNNNSIASASTSAVLKYPIVPIYGDGSELYGNVGTFYRGRGIHPRNNIAYNIVAESAENFHRALTINPVANLSAQYNLLKGLSLKSEVGVDYINLTEDIFWGVTSGDGGGTNGVGQAINTQRANWLITTTARYNTTLAENHTISAIAGHSYQSIRQDASNVTGEQFPNNDLNTLSSAAEITDGGGTVTQFGLESYFSRVNYGFKDRYILELSGRIDGSSRFGRNNRYAFFPAASAGWVISEENFMPQSNILSFLKLRASYGLTGNSEILTPTTTGVIAATSLVADFPSLSLYQGGNDYGGTPGLAPTQLENPDLRWEQTAQLDIGLNIGLFKNRVNLEADYYIKKTKDLLLNVTLPSTSGFTTITQNIGKLENKGFELSVTSNNLVGAFTWTTNFNIAFNRNKITDLDGQIITSGISRAVEGEPIGVFYTVKYAGVDPANGDALYYDLEGNTTNVYSANNRQIVGDPNPDYVGGLTNTLAYKGFDFSSLIQFVQGNEVYRDEGRFVAVSGNSVWNQTTDQLGRWRNPGDITDVPQARFGRNNGTQASSRYVEDGSFIRFKTLTLGYTLPSNLTQKIRLSNIRIYAQALNWFTITDYKGHDPEVGSNGTVNVGQGQSFFQAPPSKVLTFGINVGL